MSGTGTAPAQGWGWPANSLKAHYFKSGSNRSLCGKWLFFGNRADTMHDSPNNCADCTRRREKGSAR